MKFSKPAQVPKDFVLAHQETYEYFQKVSGEIRQAFGNVHYHVNKSCILYRQPNFTSNMVVVPPDVTITQAHVLYFEKNKILINP